MSGFTPEKIESDRRLLELLSQNFGNISSAATEIINLEAILNLPKGTEHFIADIHGEADAFRHILKNASGNIKRKVNELFSTTMREDDIRQLCSLIYYPERKLALMRSSETHIENFYKITLHLLIKVLQEVSSKYSRSIHLGREPTTSASPPVLINGTPSDAANKMCFIAILS